MWRCVGGGILLLNPSSMGGVRGRAEGHTHTGSHTHRGTHTQRNTHTHTQEHTNTHTHTHTRTHTHRNTHTQEHTHTHRNTHTHTGTHTHTHTQEHTHTHTHRNVHANVAPTLKRPEFDLILTRFGPEIRLFESESGQNWVQGEGFRGGRVQRGIGPAGRLCSSSGKSRVNS